MTETNAFMTRPTVTVWRKLQIGLARNFDELYSHHQLYVPERFVLGYFNKLAGGFRLNERFFYNESPEALGQCQEDIDAGEIQVVCPLTLPETVLEKIVKGGRIHTSASIQLNDVKRVIFGELLSLDEHIRKAGE